ncbi:MAG TPA: iron-containing alcohol dehydrogenase [Hyphomicrobiales bacterium]|nr:iron-containing alcohol dehydrogenase [Hyphomicrobiales bacterium]
MSAPSYTANWNYPTAVRFGPGRIAELGQACKAAGISRPLLVTDPGLAGLPMVEQALDICKADGLGVGLFSDVRPNPVEANLSAGLAAYKAGNHDGVIAFGGGSALDLGKLVAFMAGQTRPVWDFEDIGDWWTRADPAGIAPIVAVPTTSGTGSEVGRAGVITDVATHTKKVIFHPKMMPAIVVGDPELTVGLPPVITVGTGLDAFVHNFEAYCSPFFHPMAAGIAVEGMRLVKEYLPRATRDGKDIEARANMMASAMMGAAAFQKGLGAVHSMSHPVGSLFDTHHGMTNAVFLPYVVVFNRPAIEDKVARLAAWLGLKNQNFSGFLDWILEIRAELGVPHTLPEFGVGDDKIDLVAEMAVVDPTAGGNPVPLDVAGAKGIFKAAMEGRIG